MDQAAALKKLPKQPPAGPDPETETTTTTLAAGQQRRQMWTGIAAFAAQRVAFGLVVLVAIIFLSFLGLEMARGVPMQPAVGYAVEQSVAYVGRLFQGDLGRTAPGTVAILPIPVVDVLGNVVPRTMGLLFVAMVLAAVVGVTLGLTAAARRRSQASLSVILLSIVGVSIPSFFAALVLQLLMIQWAKAFGRPLVPLGGFGWNEHIILPALVLAARPVAQITRMTFIAVGDVLDQDFVRTARSKGLWSRQVWSRHVVRNAAIPILTTIGVSLRFALSSLPVVEFFFGWAGIGFMLLRAISRQDDNLTVALLLTLGILFLAVNLALDISYRFIDPRLRETMARVAQQDRRRLLGWIRGVMANLRGLIENNPISAWWRRRSQPPEPSPFRSVLENSSMNVAFDEGEYRAVRRRAWWRATMGNLPFILGAIIVGALLLTIFFGYRIAPQNPYLTQGLTIVDGQFRVPPFEPSSVHPWGTDVLGRDVMSLILAGAQQTLMLAALVVAARLVVGFLLGALAGWLNGGWVDRTILGMAEIVAAFPALLLAMIIILALGIRQGMSTFVVALCFVGWGEIMQFVRGEVMAIRPQLYIEGAVSVGVRTTRIIFAHILPILLAALISLAALEMGAALMLLGELGFIGIFIGGGAFAELDVGSILYHYSDVPEWGSLLSNVRTYARSYPWVAIYPAATFFVAILGFNLLGEGLRRMVATVGIGLNRLFNRYTFLAAAAVLVFFVWARSNTGAMAVYRQQASAFDGQQAQTVIEALVEPETEGRSLGTAGLDLTADAIAQQFEALGLQPAGEALTYFQPRPRAFTRIDTAPQIAIADGGPSLQYGSDYREYPGYFNGVGQAAGLVHFVAAGEFPVRGWERQLGPLANRLAGDEILLVLDDRVVDYLRYLPHGGLLVVADDDEVLQHRFTLSGRSAVYTDPLGGRERGKEVPTLWISEATANRLLAGTGKNVAELRRIAAGLSLDEAYDLWTENTVSLHVSGTLEEGVQVRNVLGYLPGVSGRAGTSETGFDRRMPGGATQNARGGEIQLDDELVVVLAQYDTPPVGPEGIFQAANDNGSGLAVMMELLRAFQEAEYQPYRSFLFVAYAGEGLDGGEAVNPGDVFRFMQAKRGFVSSFKVEAIVNLRGLGAGEGDGIEIVAGGNQRLAAVFERAARWAGASPKRAEEAVDISIVFDERAIQEGGGQEAPYLVVRWDGWEATSRTAADTLDSVSPEKLELAGRGIAQALMLIGRENRY